MGIFSRILACVLLAIAPSGNAFAAAESIIILDASGAMWSEMEGKTKIANERETLTTVLRVVAADRELGLMV